jgi:hypothetical protein
MIVKYFHESENEDNNYDSLLKLANVIKHNIFFQSLVIKINRVPMTTNGEESKGETLNK